jgi:hypothetical protein
MPRQVLLSDAAVLSSLARMGVIATAQLARSYSLHRIG